jgi:hypothetical protein
MSKNVKNKNGKIVEKKFVLGKSFKDPLDPLNVFEELEVEEFKYYYNVFLGVPVNKEEI